MLRRVHLVVPLLGFAISRAVLVSAFLPSHRTHGSWIVRSQSALASATTTSPAQDVALQNTLKDLQAQNFPLWQFDVEDVNTMNLAIWTTMNQLSEEDDAHKVCMILDNGIPTDAIKSFVSDFCILQTQGRLVDHLPELERFSLTALGPALIVETSARTDAEKAEVEARKAVEETLEEPKCTEALKSFVDRIVVGMEACPYTKTPDIAGVGLEARGVESGPVAYRYNGSSDTCAAVASFWNAVCELQEAPETEISTTLLSLPAIGPKSLERFAAVVELISRNLCLYRGDSSFGLVHFHPDYDRTLIHPVDMPAYGHLPPRSWLRPMLRQTGNTEKAESLTEDDLALSDYQRRAPHTMINILRASQLNAAVGAKSIVDLQLDDGRTEKASGLTLYSRNAIRLAAQGKEALQAALDTEMGVPPKPKEAKSEPVIFSEEYFLAAARKRAEMRAESQNSNASDEDWHRVAEEKKKLIEAEGEDAVDDWEAAADDEELEKFFTEGNE